MTRRDERYSWQKAKKIYWPDPKITCPYRFILKDTTKPLQTSPHEFGFGDYVLSYTYHLHGGHNVTCNVHVSISKMVTPIPGKCGVYLLQQVMSIVYNTIFHIAPYVTTLYLVSYWVDMTIPGKYSVYLLHQVMSIVQYYFSYYTYCTICHNSILGQLLSWYDNFIVAG